MIYTFIHGFPPSYAVELKDEDRLEIAKRRCAEELAAELMKEAISEVHRDGSVRITIKV
jgi:uncharacterized membrane protein